jgi:hypothetical protein
MPAQNATILASCTRRTSYADNRKRAILAMEENREWAMIAAGVTPPVNIVAKTQQIY